MYKRRPISFSAQIEETNREYIIVIDMSGIPQSDFNLEVGPEHLAVSVRKPDQLYADTDHVWPHYEGSFQRAFSLPGGLDLDRMHSSYVDGILRIVFPKQIEDIRADKNVRFS